MDFLLQAWIFLRNLLVILSKEEKGKRIDMFFAYVKIKLRFFIIKVLQQEVKKEKFLEFEMCFFNYGVFVSLFEEIFINKEYYFKSINKKPTIIDCGSNIGMSVIFFKWLYPNARITAFEPDDLTFEVLKENIENNNLKNVILVNKAIYSKNVTKYLYYDLNHPGSLIMSLDKDRYHTDRKKVRTTVLSQFVKKKIDFVKMDIEGMEYEAISELDITGKLSLVRELIIEYHHHIKPQEDALSNLLKKIEDSNFGYQITSLLRPPFAQKKYQDIVIYAYKKF